MQKPELKLINFKRDNSQSEHNVKYYKQHEMAYSSSAVHWK